MTAVETELKQEIEELRERVERLEQRAGPEGDNGRVRRPWEQYLPPYIQLVDSRTLKPLIDRVLREMGFDPKPPRVTAQELRERMMQQGVRPEDCIVKRMLAELRGEEE